MRNQLGWYLKGMRHAAELRRQINALSSYQQIAELLQRYVAETADGEKP